MGKTTKDEYFDNAYNQYSDTRSYLHQYIAKTLFDQRGYNTEVPEREAVILGGAPGAGKSRIVEDIIGTDGYVVIDSDDIKSYLPEYTKALLMNKKSIAADLVHNESSDIANMTFYSSVEADSSLIFDGTMKKVSKYNELITCLREYGYKINLVVVDVDVEVALERVKQRYFTPMGRFVPEDIVVSANHLVAKSFFELKDLADEFTVFNNSYNGKEPEVIFFKDEWGFPNVENNEAYEEFLGKCELE